jgi:predicted kinase
LIAFGGLPGTGKSTIARQVAGQTGGTYLRIDTIEQAILRTHSEIGDIGPLGYVVARDVARDQLRLGRHCVVDCVNPLPVTRAMWRDLAAECGVSLLEVETVCSDPVEHRRRVETRSADIAGHRLPTWSEVTGRDYAPWDRDRLVLDTAVHAPEKSIELVLAAVRQLLQQTPEDS